MAEEFQRTKLYEYRANSNLVLEAERDNRRRSDEPTGEVESLYNKIADVRMGDKLSRSSIPELNDRIQKGKLRRQRDEEEQEAAKKRKKENRVFTSSRGSTVLTETEDLDSINYRPKTRESRIAYEEILSFIQSHIGDQPQDILRGAAEEVITILKDDSYRDPERHIEVEKILSKMSAEKFNKLVNLGKQITDFNTKDVTEDEDAKMDEEMGVAVVFDDEEDGGPQEVDEVRDSDNEEDEEDEGGVETQGGTQLKGGDDHGGEFETDDVNRLSVHDIDAHWLQRQLSKYYTDANLSAKLAEDTLSILQIVDERVCENKLVVLLDFDKFDFIKLLLRNRAKIFYCTRLKQAQNDIERAAIEAELRADVDGGGAAILDQLQQKASAESWTQDRIGEFASKARQEARALNRGKGGGPGGNSLLEDVEETVGGPRLSRAGYGRREAARSRGTAVHSGGALDGEQEVRATGEELARAEERVRGSTRASYSPNNSAEREARRGVRAAAVVPPSVCRHSFLESYPIPYGTVCFARSRKFVVVCAYGGGKDQRGADVHAKLVRPAPTGRWKLRARCIQDSVHCSYESPGSRMCAKLW